MKSTRSLSSAIVAGLIILVLVAMAVPPLAPTADAQHSDHAMTYDENLAMLRASSVRNTNHDLSPWRDTPMDQLVIENHLGPRSDYLNNPAGNPEQAFPTPEGGQFRIACEFSHFGYDDPVVHPGQPGAAHLHMFWGNTDVNALSTEETLRNSGSSTCNGQELNRTGYWAPAVFDGSGNVRIPERIVVYYKGEGLANGASQMYPPGAAMIPSVDINTVSASQGGAAGKSSYTCSDQWSGSADPAANTIPGCDGNRFFDEYGVVDNPHVVLEMNVKFPQCWNGQDASNPANYAIPGEGGWYYSLCPTGWTTLPNLEYFINYRVEIGENTADWYLSSDIDPATFTKASQPGSSIHADWWGAWKPEINQMWLDNCVNFSLPDEDTGCGFGYLTNGGPDGDAPIDGPALKFRPQYDGPSSVPATTLFAELCPTGRPIASAEEAAYCAPGDHDHGDEDPDPTPNPVPTPDAEPTPVAEQRRCSGEVATIVGTSSDDVLIGTNGRDVIWAGGGSDRIEAGAGDDLVCAGLGDDIIDGGEGNDVIYAGFGFDNVWGGPGDDDLRGGADDDWLFGQDGSDTLRGGPGADELHGDANRDMLRGGPGADVLYGESGSDDLQGGPGDDVLYGDSGSDDLRGGPGDDELHGGYGSDTLRGGQGADQLRGGGGKDEVFGNAGYDNAWGGAGDDELHGGADDDWLFGEAGNDTLRGGQGSDELHGEEGDDELAGNAGDDILVARYGIDTMWGGPGTDDCQRVADDPSADQANLNRGCELASELEAFG